MKIGELSKAAGVKVGTIRFYERKKLLKPAGRTPSGYRTYSEQDIQSVKGIRLTRIWASHSRKSKNYSISTNVTRLSDPIVDRTGMRQAIAMTKRNCAVLDHKVRELRRMRPRHGELLTALRTAAGNACPFLNRTPSSSATETVFRTFLQCSPS